MSQADTDENGGAKLTSAEKKELAELRKKARQLEMENEILKRAAAYFAQASGRAKAGPVGAGRCTETYCVPLSARPGGTGLRHLWS
jgi:transposase